MPTVGGLLAGLTLWLGNRLTSRLRQKTTTDYMEAIVVGSGSISVPASIVKSLSALFSISTGASIGREGPLVQISSLVASLIAQFRELPVAQRRQLVACGAAAGIASAYNAPIAGSFFVAEIILGTVVVEALGPLILAAVVATFTAQVLHGGGPIYKSPGFTLQSPLELIPLACVGLGLRIPGACLSLIPSCGSTLVLESHSACPGKNRPRRSDRRRTGSYQSRCVRERSRIAIDPLSPELVFGRNPRDTSA